MAGDRPTWYAARGRSPTAATGGSGSVRFRRGAGRSAASSVDGTLAELSQIQTVFGLVDDAADPLRRQADRVSDRERCQRHASAGEAQVEAAPVSGASRIRGVAGARDGPRDWIAALGDHWHHDVPVRLGEHPAFIGDVEPGMAEVTAKLLEPRHCVDAEADTDPTQLASQQHYPLGSATRDAIRIVAAAET